MPEELARDVGLSAEDKIWQIMKNAHNRLQQEMMTRFTRLKNPNSKFGFLLDLHHLLFEMSPESCFNLANFYDTDIVAKELFNDICDCKMTPS